MQNAIGNSHISHHWATRLFIVAGSFMLLNTAMLWIRLLSDYQLSILWAAIPAIIALASAVLGLFKLYPHISSRAPRMARISAGFALLACTALTIAALWIFAVSVFGQGIQQHSPWMLMLIAVFMSAMIMAFLFSAIAFLLYPEQRKTGYLLTVPLVMWAVMLVVGMMKGMEAGISLDFYTNGVIGAAFLGLGVSLKTQR